MRERKKEGGGETETKQSQGYRSTQLPMCCQSNIPVIVRIKSNLPSAGDVFVFEGVHKNVSNGNNFAQKVCPTPFADRTPLRKKTGRQHTAARHVVSSMMGLIIVSCSYF